MKTYHGERTERGCDVTVDGAPLRMCSDLSGNATTAFDWGYIGSGQLSVALLSNLLHTDIKAKAMCEAFEREVIARMPHDNWTMTDSEFAAALAALVGVDGARAEDAERDNDAPAAFGDMPATGTDLVSTLQAEDTAAAGSMLSEGGPLAAREVKV